MWNSMNWKIWYSSLIKPNWTPDASTISLIWTILYPIIFISFGIIFYLAWKKKVPKKIILPFVINLIANFTFTPILFNLQNLSLATLDILIIWATIVWGITLIWKFSKVLALVQIPYLIWVSIAAFLQLSITLANF